MGELTSYQILGEKFIDIIRIFYPTQQQSQHSISEITSTNADFHLLITFALVELGFEPTTFGSPVFDVSENLFMFLY